LSLVLIDVEGYVASCSAAWPKVSFGRPVSRYCSFADKHELNVKCLSREGAGSVFLAVSLWGDLISCPAVVEFVLQTRLGDVIGLIKMRPEHRR
jgi:hypothetical protein